MLLRVQKYDGIAIANMMIPATNKKIPLRFLCASIFFTSLLPHS